MHLFCTCTRTRSVSAPIYSYIHDALTRFMNNVVVAVAAAAHYVTFVWYFFFMFIQMLQRKHLCNRRHSNPMPATAIAKSLTHTTHTHTQSNARKELIAFPHERPPLHQVSLYAINECKVLSSEVEWQGKKTWGLVCEWDRWKLQSVCSDEVEYTSFKWLKHGSSTGPCDHSTVRHVQRNWTVPFVKCFLLPLGSLSNSFNYNLQLIASERLKPR